MATLTTYSNSFDEIQKEFQQVNNQFTNTLSTIAKDIKFANFDTEEIKDALIKFAVEQKRLAESESTSERFLRKVAAVPFFGNVARKAADNHRTERLNEESVSGLVGTMYKGLKKQGEDVELALKRLNEVKATTVANIEVMTQLEDKISALLQEESLAPTFRVKVKMMDVQVKTMIEKSRDKIDTLNLVIPATEANLMTIYRELPISEAELLSDLAISTNVNKVNALAEDLKEVRHLKEMVTNNIYDSTQKSILNLIESNSISQKEMLQIENNVKRREELHKQTNEAMQKSIEQTNTMHAKITQLAIESQERRQKHYLALENNTTH